MASKDTCPMCGSRDIEEPRTVNEYGAQTVTCRGCGRTYQPEAVRPGSWGHRMISQGPGGYRRRDI